MRKSIIFVTAVALISPAAAKADPVVYEFSFANVLGTAPGTVSGLVGFDFLASPTDSGTGAASFIEILSAPPGIPPSVEGDVVTDWITQAMNTFTIVGGLITDYQFGASEGAVPGLNDNVFCLNNGGFFVVGGVYICGPGENYFGDAFDYVYNVDGIDAVTFRQVRIAEPGTLALLLLGLLGAAVSRRGRNT